MLKNYAIILAAGSGSRFGSSKPKQFIKIAGKTIFEHTLSTFQNSPIIDEIVVVISADYRDVAESLLLKNNFSKVTHLVNGGDSRKDSSYIGISAIEEEEANVMIHDCARPFVSEEILSNSIKALKKYDAVDVAVPSADTIIKVHNDLIQEIPERKYLLRGQTPQSFKLSVIKRAHELSLDDSNFTDDCGLVLKHHLADVYVVEGSEENMKVTYPTDAYIADKLFQLRKLVLDSDNDLSNLKDKVVVVVGGSSGIGKEIVDLSNHYGARAYSLSTRNHCDVSSFEQVEASFKRIEETEGHIDVVINSSGTLNMGKLCQRDILDIRKDFEINYLGSVYVAKAAVPYLRKSQGALILFSSSSYTRGRALYSTYSSCKAGIVNLAQALSEELIDEGIRVNVMCPERTATPMRTRAFGREPLGSLLSARKVAIETLRVCLTSMTGHVIDVRRDQK